MTTLYASRAGGRNPTTCSPKLRGFLGLVLACLFALVGNSLSAQDTGVVTGRVLNAQNGMYLPRAVVVVEGTSLETLTDETGTFVIRNVPAGERTITATFTGQEPVSATVVVTAGASVAKNLAFNRAPDQGEETEIVLAPFEVQENRYKNAAEIAVNEERYSVNIKNVVSAEEFGEIPGGNVGEFIKYLPGVELEYGGTYIAPTDAFGVSVRGFGAEDTAIMIDGVPVTSASQASLTNQVGLDMLSINNASRIELIKVPTPDMPMNSVGGQINLISKSAFEYAKPSFSYKAYVVLNSEHMNPFTKVVGATDKRVTAGQPGFELSYIQPFSEKLGLTISASRFSQYSANRQLRPEYGVSNVNLDLRPLGGANNTPATNGVGTISPANPFLTRVSITDSPRTSISYSGSLRLDFKPFDGLSLSGNYQYSTYDGSDTDRRMQFRIQRPIDWGANYVYSQPYMTAAQSATGSAYNPGNSVSMDITSRDKSGETHSGYLRATYKKGGWDFSAVANRSRSRASFYDFENGHFSGVDVSMSVGTVRFQDVVNGVPGRIAVFSQAGGLANSEIDYTKLANWGVPTIQGKRGNAESEDENALYQVDLKRDLDFLPFHEQVSLAIKVGARREEIDKVKWGLGTGYRETYVGPAIASADILDTTYLGTSPGWGFAPQEFISTYKLYDIYKANPANFQELPTDADDNYFSRIGQNKAIFETNDAIYAQIEGSALNGRLNFVAGLRDETVKREGYGPQGDGRWNYIKNPDGTLYRNATLLGGLGTVRVDQTASPLFATTATGTALRADLDSKGISYPTAVINAGTLERAMLERRTTPFTGESKGDPNYSISSSYEITKSLVAKVAYSISSGRIKIEDARNGLLSGNQNDFNISESETLIDDGNGNLLTTGSIKIANPNLEPESSKNWDFALTYYTSTGGKFGAGAYFKRIENFTESFITDRNDPLFETILDGLGLDYDTYQLWTIETTENGIGTGKVWGYELEASQDMRILPFLGEAGKSIRFFANYSHSKREETNTTRISSRPAASALASGGITYSAKRFSVSMRANWRDYVFNGDKVTFTLTDGTRVGIGEFVPSALKVDLSANYQMTERTSIYFSARNILEAGNDRQRYDRLGIYPAYARGDLYRDTGVQITVGVNGRF